MRVDIRVYKRWDTDLIAFCDAGYPIGLMMRDAICAYANGQPLFYLIDEYIPFDMNNKTSFHLCFDISPKDKNTIYLLKNIKHGYRNSFCKMVLRNAFIQQDLCGYFADNNLIGLQNANMNYINVNAFQNVQRCSEVRINKPSKVNKVYKDRNNTQNIQFNIPNTFSMPVMPNYPNNIYQPAYSNGQINLSFNQQPLLNFPGNDIKDKIKEQPAQITNQNTNNYTEINNSANFEKKGEIITNIAEQLIETEIEEKPVENNSLSNTNNSSLMNAFLSL